jgi:NADH-quinone oxidoreductase subunit N
VTNWSTISILLPEIVLILLAVILFLAGTFSVSRRGMAILSSIVLVIAFFLLARTNESFFAGTSGLSGPLLLDTLGGTTRWIAVALGLGFLLMLARDATDAWVGETLGMVVLTVVGLMLVSCSRDFILLFLGLELISIPTYVLLFLGRRDGDSVEATTKYFFLSILSSAVMLYGFAMLYGAAGSTDINVIRTVLADGDALAGGVFVPFAMVLLFAGLGFKIAAVPFHFYAPDVYQATTNANAGLLAVIPKVAGIVAIVRLLPLTLPVVGDFGWQIALILSLVTMTIGNVCALWQQNIRRLMAYSSIAHAGYMLIGIAVALRASNSSQLDSAFDGQGAFDGYSACLLYLFVYSLASLGTFAVLSHLSTTAREVTDVSDLSGLNRNRPVAAALLAVFMFSLSGIPPLAGFWGKLTLFTGALAASGLDEATRSPWFMVLAITGVLNAAIAAAYYLRLVSVTYFRSPEFDFSVPRVTPALGVAVACGVLVICTGVLPARLVGHFEQVGRTIEVQSAVTQSRGLAPDVVEKGLPIVDSKTRKLVKGSLRRPH